MTTSSIFDPRKLATASWCWNGGGMYSRSGCWGRPTASRRTASTTAVASRSVPSSPQPNSSSMPASALSSTARASAPQLWRPLRQSARSPPKETATAAVPSRPRARHSLLARSKRRSLGWVAHCCGSRAYSPSEMSRMSTHVVEASFAHGRGRTMAAGASRSGLPVSAALVNAAVARSAPCASSLSGPGRN